MSETRHYRGKLKLVTTGKEQVESTAKELLGAEDRKELPSCFDSWGEYLMDVFYKGYVVINDSLYAVEKKEVGEEDVFVASETEDGYKFEVQYYDGVMSFDEAIEEAINGIKG